MSFWYLFRTMAPQCRPTVLLHIVIVRYCNEGESLVSYSKTPCNGNPKRNAGYRLVLYLVKKNYMLCSKLRVMLDSNLVIFYGV